MGKFEVLLNKQNKFVFYLLASNGQVILKSQTFSSKEAAVNGIRAVGKCGTDESNYRIRETQKGNYYFILLAENGEEIGRSEIYISKAALYLAIKSVIRNLGS